MMDIGLMIRLMGMVCL
jgi:hypothetical protein